MLEPRNAEGVSEWLAEHGIKNGEWCILTIQQLKTRQRPDQPLKTRAWATGMLHANKYKSQLATTMSNGKKRPLTPADIIRELWEVSLDFYGYNYDRKKNAITPREDAIPATPEELASLMETKESIRRALAELEEDGVSLRTDLKGKPLKDLTPEQLRRLPKGTTHMYFWFKPKRATDKTIEQQWREHIAAQHSLNGKVGKKLGPVFSIRQILNIFHVGKFTKSQLSDPVFTATVNRAWERANAAFQQEFNVVSESLPTEVATPRPPEVDAGGGAFERKNRKKENQQQQRASAAPPEGLLLMNFEDFHERTCEHFAAAGKPTPTVKLTRPIHAALKADAQAFTEYLTPAKLAPIKSAGVLPDLLESFQSAQRAAVKRQQVGRAEQQTQAENEQRRNRQFAEEILKSPEADAEQIEWARQILKQDAA